MTAEPSIPCEWGGKVYDLDLTSYSGRELHELEQRTGGNWRSLFVSVLNLDPDAVRAAFWLTDRRDNADLRWSEYDGPPVRVVQAQLDRLRDTCVALGKALSAQVVQVADESGSDDSPSTVDTSPDSTTTWPAPTGS